MIQLTETVADQVFQRPNVIFILADDLVRVNSNEIINYIHMIMLLFHYYVTMSRYYYYFRAGMMSDFMDRYVTNL